MPDDLRAFAQKLQLSFSDEQLLQQVFVHRSYLNEHRAFPLDHNERLEFLGDAVLELIVTEYLYKTFDKPEGELTNWRSALVRGEMLSQLAQQIGMGDYLLLSRGEQKSQGKARQLILANAFEALIGAIYLDAGYEAAVRFITTHVISQLERILEEGRHIDAKSDLQEKSQEQLGVTPTYNVLESTGPDHDKTFVVGVYFGDRLLAKGTGSSKQRAEQAAASEALKTWGQETR